MEDVRQHKLLAIFMISNLERHVCYSLEGNLAAIRQDSVTLGRPYPGTESRMDVLIPTRRYE